MATERQLEEWIKQAQYDLETAEAMLHSGRYIYCVFMCHLAAEKMLKGLYLKNLDKNPPKVHSLVYLVQTQKLQLPNEMKDFIENLDKVSVPTRYPEELDKLLKEYDKGRTQTIFKNSKEVVECLKQESKKS